MDHIQAIIFDLDGLMVDSEPLSLKAWQKLLIAYGYRLDEEDYSQLIGVDEHSTINRLRQGRVLPLSDVEILDIHYRYWMEIASQDAQPVNGLFDLIEAIRTHGLKMGVASNSRSYYVSLVLKKIGLNSNFECVVTSDQVERGKPAPDIYEAVARCLEVSPIFCLAIEDSPVGLQSALNAGMRCVVVPNHSLIHEKYDGAFARFPTLGDLIKDLDNILELS